MKYYIALFQKVKNMYESQVHNPSEIVLICPTLRLYEENELKLLLPQFLIENELGGEALLKKHDISYPVEFNTVFR